MSSSTPTQPFRFTIDAIGGLASGAKGSNQAELADDGLLRETRKELRRIVADVSVLCHSRVDPKRFWPKFLNLVGMAIAAEAAIVWHKQEITSASVPIEEGGQHAWTSISHCGSLDNRLLDHALAPCHAAMISEVGDVGGPVAVPPGSEWDNDEPGNPTSSLAAVVPVPVDPDEPVKWLVEFFLPPGGGPATQRGYLRFLAQMADLAAEYLRAERLRSVTRAAEFSHRAALMLVNLQKRTQDLRFPNYLVDAIAQFASAERVSLIRSGDRSAKVLAVNGVSQVDRLSPVTKSLIEIAEEADGLPGMLLADEHAEGEIPSSEGLDGSQETARGRLMNQREVPDEVPAEVVQAGSLHLRGVVVLDSDSQCRLVLEDSYPRRTTSEELERWQVLASQLYGLLSIHHQQTMTGLSRLVTRSNRSSPSFLRRSFVPLGLTATFILAALIPVPFVIPASGHLQPAAMQTLYAPRNAVVSEIYVDHNQHVMRGEPVLKLRDDQLSQQMEQLNGRLAVLSEQLITLQEEQARANGRDASLMEELSLRERLIREDVSSVQSQLKICETIEQSLLLFAHCDGKVDAWQLSNTLKDRPIDRGQAILSIIPDNQPWYVHAHIPQERLDHFIALQQNQTRSNKQVTVKAIASAFPEIEMTGTLAEIGPVSGPASAPANLSSAPAALATFEVDANRLPLLQSGAPVDIGIPCGHRPLAYVVSQDLIRLSMQTFYLYR